MIQELAGLTESEDHQATWLDWRESLRNWSNLAQLDYEVSWKRQDKAKLGMSYNLIRENIP
ncbi:hypothetical protein FRC12_005853 [Ceratobasidium sp. 428]|nr:hypothetical protein FRC12_005853 [Ceratobasidium sp. 428]